MQSSDFGGDAFNIKVFTILHQVALLCSTLPRRVRRWTVRESSASYAVII